MAASPNYNPIQHLLDPAITRWLSNKLLTFEPAVKR